MMWSKRFAVAASLARWRKADAEGSNINKIMWVGFGVFVAALMIVGIGAFAIFGTNKVQTAAANALNSVQNTSGTATAGTGYSGTYSGNGTITLPSYGGSGN
ncbi:MAG: hypothetical protein K6T30_06265 [Alicyclobacillus sp.]|nr:hypothetical protein [Alicyclobacillaceae bacterium]MCL6548495.1 hypothetical protein [Alicyclobacillus sp.]